MSIWIPPLASRESQENDQDASGYLMWRSSLRTSHPLILACDIARRVRNLLLSYLALSSAEALSARFVQDHIDHISRPRCSSALERSVAYGHLLQNDEDLPHTTPDGPETAPLPLDGSASRWHRTIARLDAGIRSVLTRAASQRVDDHLLPIPVRSTVLLLQLRCR
ncbi:hypothetical protein OH77DRAFT_1418238 [Trametes cingulata]|nr:hypothetical protein OH77DRAFT_1418238 [Trametes cingulata]